MISKLDAAFWKRSSHAKRFWAILLLSAAAVAGLPAAARAQARIEAEGVPGKPYGIGVLAVELPRGQRMADLNSGQISLTERQGRILYPTYETRALAKILRGVGAGPRRLTVFFLFRGNEPLDLTLATPQPIRATLTPRPGGNSQQLLASWWRGFSQRPATDVFPSINDFLTATLARRFNLPLAANGQSGGLSGSLSGQFELLSGGEALRTRLARQAILGDPSSSEPLDQPLPSDAPLDAAAELPTEDETPAIEPIALRVPEECFYVRTGSFENFMWLRRRGEEWGGNARNLISEQAVDYGLNQRMQRQLGLQETALGDVLGPTVISDVALIGTDMFLREGAALGILFEARNSALLGIGLGRQRSDLLKTEKSAKEETLKIAGKDVSLVATPDNRVRSFYATDGNYHFVTTSRALVERFLQTGQKDSQAPGGARSLGAAGEFRYARSIMPVDRADTAFVYLSRAFFHNLMSPHYQVEMVRRLRSATEMELVLLAQLLARGEGRPADTLEQLVAADALPRGFGQRPDGSRLELTDHGPVDSLRGARGTFVPIPDMPVGQITASEAQQYQDFLTAAASWGAPDPLLLSIRHSASKRGGLEHVAIDLQAAPLTAQHFDFLNRWMGPPAAQRLAPVTGNLITFEAAVRGGGQVQAGDHFLFFGLQDLLGGDLPADNRPLLEALRVAIGQSPLRGYLGAWPEPGLLAKIGGTADVPVDPSGYARLITGVWRRTFPPFTVMSFHRDVLELVTPQFRLEPSPRPVQIALRMQDLQGTNLSAWVNREGYQHAAKMSAANLRLLATLADDYRVPSNQCLEAAESVLDARLVDPLGGQYEVVEGGAATGGGTSRWRSTRSASGAPADYQFPALTWIRGLDAESWFDSGRLVLHAEVEMPALGSNSRKATNEKAGGRAF